VCLACPSRVCRGEFLRAPLPVVVCCEKLPACTKTTDTRRPLKRQLHGRQWIPSSMKPLPETRVKSPMTMFSIYA
jgi:hypothetical protein